MASISVLISRWWATDAFRRISKAVGTNATLPEMVIGFLHAGLAI
jgi:hypothetical protein